MRREPPVFCFVCTLLNRQRKVNPLSRTREVPFGFLELKIYLYFKLKLSNLGQCRWRHKMFMWIDTCSKILIKLNWS